MAATVFFDFNTTDRAASDFSVDPAVVSESSKSPSVRGPPSGVSVAPTFEAFLKKKRIGAVRPLIPPISIAEL